MKNNKVLVIVMVVFLNLISCIMVGQDIFNGNSEYNDALAEARSFSESNLCSKAIEAYNEVVSIKDTVEIRKEMVETFGKGLDNGEFSNQYEIVNEVIDMLEVYPEDIKMYEIVTSFLAKYEQYEDCVELLNKAKALNLSSEGLKKTLESVRYMYSRKYSMYTNVYPEYDGKYLVDDDGEFRFVDENGSSIVDNGLSFATPFSEGYSLVKKINPEGVTETYLVNSEGIRQAYFNNGIVDSTGVGKGKDEKGNDILLIACQINGTYQYYDMKGQPLYDKYMYAGRFRNNVAAVQVGDNQWKFLNAEGKFITNTVFTDVVLNEFGDCAPKGFIIAAEKDKYCIYDTELKKIGNFSCDGAKAFVDDLAAFKSGDKWGFVDSTGKVVIEPQYEDAKSFSNGIAAVCINSTWKFIDKSTKVVIDGEYEDAGYLSKSGMCFVKEEGYWTSLKMYYVEE